MQEIIFARGKNFSVMKMNNVEKFVERWTDRGDEKSDSQTLWIDLLTNIFEVRNVAEFIFFRGARSTSA